MYIQNRSPKIGMSVKRVNKGRWMYTIGNLEIMHVQNRSSKGGAYTEKGTKGDGCTEYIAMGSLVYRMGYQNKVDV